MKLSEIEPNEQIKLRREAWPNDAYFICFTKFVIDPYRSEWRFKVASYVQSNYTPSYEDMIADDWQVSVLK